MIENLYKGSGSTPIPDPTLLTSQLVNREIFASRELIEAKWSGRNEAVSSSLAQLGISIDEKVNALKTFMIEKIEGSVEIIKTRLDGNDTALVAALQAQKEAATKQTENFTAILDESKKGTTKQIDSLNEKIDDLKERLSEAAGRSHGASATIAIIISGIAASASLMAVAFAFLHGFGVH